MNNRLFLAAIAFTFAFASLLTAGWAQAETAETPDGDTVELECREQIVCERRDMLQGKAGETVLACETKTVCRAE
jgi:hypothetical protein